MKKILVILFLFSLSLINLKSQEKEARTDDSPKNYLGFDINKGFSSVKSILEDKKFKLIDEVIFADPNKIMYSYTYQNVEMKFPNIFNLAIPDTIRLWVMENTIEDIFLIFSIENGNNISQNTTFFKTLQSCATNVHYVKDKNYKATKLFLNIPFKNKMEDQVTVVMYESGGFYIRLDFNKYQLKEY